VLLASSAWAGDAHSAWLELLLSLGVVGAAVGFGVVVALAARLLRKMPDAPLPSRVLPILFVYLLVMSPVATGFAAPGPEPGLGFALLAFCYGATAMRERAAARVAGTQRVPWQPQFRPVRI
jgi:O-antigen ligase